ncbi:MAG: NAD-dependent deacylase [Candidatus Kapaibacterium sp.]|nr:NAD-dependent deacylase [Candidatus Kapabacteria bacterium]
MKFESELIESLVNSKRVSVLTGAGISAESGIQTFRDPDGLWAKFNPAELASMDGFMSNPKLVWEWYQYRRSVINNSKPNPGHYAIAEMQEIFDEFSLITQNVDRLHHKAGSQNVIELHGNIIENFCVECKAPFESSDDVNDDEVPICKSCGGLVRPAVVWFGESLPEPQMTQAYKAASNSEVFFSIGTSAEVYPAAQLPLIASDSGAVVIEVNTKHTAISGRVDFCLIGKSGEILPNLLKIIKNIKAEKI